MRIIRDLHTITDKDKGNVVALGNFDGVHLGHQAILRECVAQARKYHTQPAVMTFEPHPREFFARAKGAPINPLRIYPLREKLELLEECGIERVFLMRFNAKLAATSAESFVSDILVNTLAVKHVITGKNFAFGRNRAGSAEALAAHGRHHDFGYTAMEAVSGAQGEVISSSAIRQALGAADMDKAASMLGRNYRIEGHVKAGDKRGRALGFPTANINVAHLFPPRFGVYAARLFLPDGKSYDAVANIGIRPTFAGNAPLLETHAFGLDEDIYGQYAGVELLYFLREEKKFNHIDELRTQITTDCQHAKQLLTERKHA